MAEGKNSGVNLSITPVADDGSIVTITGSAPEPKITKMTDSGTTHTVPNDSVVTVTRHTIITAGIPPQPSSVNTAEPSSIIPTSSITSEIPLPSTSQGSPGVPSNQETQTTLSIKDIVGIAVGGVAIIIFLAISFLLIKRHRRGKKSVSDAEDDANGDEKHFPAHISAHTTGTQADRDPFAEFGGREDDPRRLHNGVFEMDATHAAPVELPAIDTRPSTAHTKEDQSTPSDSRNPRDAVVKQTKSTNPQANLTILRTESGQPTYVNQWNQWKETNAGKGR